MQKITLIGNLTRDPESRTVKTSNGEVTVCDFTVAVNRDRENADFFRVSAWRKLGETCKQYLAKGRKVYVEGTVSARAYEDKNGGTRVSLDVTAQSVEFLSRGEGNGQPADKPSGFTPVTEEVPF